MNMSSITISRTKHPIMYYRKKWYRHKYKRTKTPSEPVEIDLNGIKFRLDFSLGSNVKKMYCGGYEFEIVDVMKKHLRPGDTFIDIGANIGYLSAVGAGIVGTKGVVHSFEPVPAYYEQLRETALLNSAYTIIANNFALGEIAGEAPITISGKERSIGSNSMVPGFLSRDPGAGETRMVPVNRLDEYTREKKLSNISLIKIDVEGFELPVLKGAAAFFDVHRKNLPVIVVEITNWGYDLLESSLAELEDFMASFGYKPYCLCGRHRFDMIELQDEKEKLSADILFKA